MVRITCGALKSSSSACAMPSRIALRYCPNWERPTEVFPQPRSPNARDCGRWASGPFLSEFNQRVWRSRRYHGGLVSPAAALRGGKTLHFSEVGRTEAQRSLNPDVGYVT